MAFPGRVLLSAPLRLGASLFLMLALAGWWLSTLGAPEATLLLRDRHGQFLAEVTAAPDDELGYWPLRELPPRVVAATLVAEDRRFWQHPGVDPLAIARALGQNLSRGKRASGASTIAMQVARMQHPGSRTYWRKMVEMFAALTLTARNGRTVVIEQYLRLAPYGHRIHGIVYAARRYLAKPVEDLSWAETAFLAAIPQAPAHMDPYRESGRARARQRARRILAALHGQGSLDAEEYDLAQRQLEMLAIPPLPHRRPEALHLVERFREWALSPDVRRTLQGQIDTTIDLDLQATVEQMARDTVDGLERRGVGNAAVLVVDRATNEVRAAIGSANYFDKRHAGAFDYTRVMRSPGSTLKPFLFAYALERGVITPATILDDIQRAPSDIINADEAFLGPMLPRVALANSRNVPAANMLALIGLDNGYAFLRRLGLHDGNLRPQHFGLGLSIGAMPVTLERLVRAYTTLAREGVFGDLVWYRGQPFAAPQRLLSEETARQVSLFLADPMARLPSFPRMGPSEFPFPVALKTGTSSRYRDALTIAYSTRYVVGVWLGHPDHRPMSRLTAYHSAATLAHDVLSYLHRDQGDGLEDLQFPPPEGFRAERICALSGRRATPACDHVVLEWFRPGQEPVEPCSVHVQLAVDSRDGRLASVQTPPSFAQVRSFVDLPPRYAAWAAAAGLQRPPRDISALGGRTVVAAAVPDGDTPLVWPPAGAKVPQLRLVAPDGGQTIVRDPEAPQARSTLALRVVVDPPVEQVVWYVDDKPFRLADYPYTARWPLAAGAHTFQARLPLEDIRSRTIRVTVQ
ncbi:MAG: transglycosylase domain-containing protein [Deltaproteobacteria bacterium]|nr:transglycosylase domain-containing protein [Deltaproteobacteria bacterium]